MYIYVCVCILIVLDAPASKQFLKIWHPITKSWIRLCIVSFDLQHGVTTEHKLQTNMQSNEKLCIFLVLICQFDGHVKFEEMKTCALFESHINIMSDNTKCTCKSNVVILIVIIFMSSICIFEFITLFYYSI